MRIIAGNAGGRLLLAPKGMDTRPTQDKVKESLFSILQGELADARVLDLFAGSGALGLEAISRGAAFAVFCDKARRPSRPFGITLRRWGLLRGASFCAALGRWRFGRFRRAGTGLTSSF